MSLEEEPSVDAFLTIISSPRLARVEGKRQIRRRERRARGRFRKDDAAAMGLASPGAVRLSHRGRKNRRWCSYPLSHGPSYRDDAQILVEAEGLPHSTGPINDIIPAGWLPGMLSVAPVPRVALIHHLCRCLPSIARRDANHLPTPASSGVPPGRQRHHSLGVCMVRIITLGRATAIPTFAEVIEG
ncbi:hypothetical protein EJ110_NYTH37139 [Nymphaea thermarum]|nr:hypothetical protein EJ110_NYTH37139 [Nymphaea thermarum]